MRVMRHRTVEETSGSNVALVSSSVVRTGFWTEIVGGVVVVAVDVDVVA